MRGATNILSLSHHCALLGCASTDAGIAEPELNRETSSCENMAQHTQQKMLILKQVFLQERCKSKTKIFKDNSFWQIKCWPLVVHLHAVCLHWALYCIMPPLMIAVCIRFHKYDSVYLAGSSPTVYISLLRCTVKRAERNVIRGCFVS